MTNLVWLRHATAQDPDAAVADADRRLVRKGERQVLRVAAFCQRHNLLPQHLLCSPLLRAQQTAQLLQASLPHCPAPQTVAWLHIDTPVPTLLAELQAYVQSTAGQAIWLVGHEPCFSAAISHLLGQQARIVIQVKKAAVVCLDYDPAQGAAVLQWSIPNALMK